MTEKRANVSKHTARRVFFHGSGCLRWHTHAFVIILVAVQANASRRFSETAIRPREESILPPASVPCSSSLHHQLFPFTASPHGCFSSVCYCRLVLFVAFFISSKPLISQSDGTDVILQTQCCVTSGHHFTQRYMPFKLFYFLLL